VIKGYVECLFLRLSGSHKPQPIGIGTRQVDVKGCPCLPVETQFDRVPSFQ